MEDKLILQILRRIGVREGDKLVVQRGDEMVGLDISHVREGVARPTQSARKVAWPKGTPRPVPATTKLVGFEVEDGDISATPPRPKTT